MQSKLETAARIIPGEESPYGHFFGGPALHAGAHFEGAEAPIQLLYHLNLEDPALKALVPVGGVTWLPFYYGFQFEHCRFGYVLEASDRIRILNPRQKFIKDWPYRDYPAAFPQTPIRIESISYEDQKTLALMHTLEDRGIPRWISPADRDQLKAWHYPFTQIGGYPRLLQWTQASECLNESCAAHGKRWPMQICMVVWHKPVPGVNVWGEPHGVGVQLVYQQCGSCGAIYVLCECD